MQNTNTISAEQEAQNYIESLDLSPEQLKILRSMNILIQIYSANNKKDMDKRFELLESSMRHYFEQLIGEHINSMDDVLNKYMGEWYRKNIVPEKLKVSMEHLTDKIKYM